MENTDLLLLLEEHWTLGGSASELDRDSVELGFPTCKLENKSRCSLLCPRSRILESSKENEE